MTRSAGAAAAVRCLGVGPADRVAIVHNDGQVEIAEALAHAAEAAGADRVDVVAFPDADRPGQDPPASVVEAMRRADVILAPTLHSISHTAARHAATARGARIATLPGITAEMLRRTLNADYADLLATGTRLAARLTAARTCRVTSPAGTDLRLDLDGREGVADTGALAADGAFGNLPAGEAYIAPIEGSAEGVVVFEQSLAGRSALAAPIRVEVARGRAVHATGPGADWLLATLDAGGAGGRHLAELGIGTNANARPSGSILESEKALGTAHVAFGDNATFGGANVAGVHIDGLICAPTITLDGQPVSP